MFSLNPWQVQVFCLLNLSEMWKIPSPGCVFWAGGHPFRRNWPPFLFEVAGLPAWHRGHERKHIGNRPIEVLQLHFDVRRFLFTCTENHRGARAPEPPTQCRPSVDKMEPGGCGGTRQSSFARWPSYAKPICRQFGAGRVLIFSQKATGVLRMNAADVGEGFRLVSRLAPDMRENTRQRDLAGQPWRFKIWRLRNDEITRVILVIHRQIADLCVYRRRTE